MADDIREEWSNYIKHEAKSSLCNIIMGINSLEIIHGMEFQKETPTTENHIKVIAERFSCDKEKQSEILGLIRESVMKADRFVHDLVNFSRPVSLKFKPCEINKPIETALDSIKTQLSFKDIKIIKDFATGSPLVMIDENQIKQFFINIILNSLPLMSRGKELIIRTYTKELTELKDGIGRRATDFFRLQDIVLICEIEYTNIGIPKDKLSKVSNSFFTVKLPAKGVSQGLTGITRSIVDRHKGLIHIESNEMQDTKFIVTLPIIKESKNEYKKN